MNRFVEWLARVQIRQPELLLVIVALITIWFGSHASRLTLSTRYDSLLPDNAQSVRDLHELTKRVTPTQTILVVLEHEQPQVLHAMGDAIVERLRQLPPNVVRSADDGFPDARAFLAPRSALFLESADLARINEMLDARWRYETSFSLDANAVPPALPSTSDLTASLQDRLPPRYFANAEGTALVIVVQTPSANGDVPTIKRLVDEVQAIVADVAVPTVPVCYFPDRLVERLRVSYAGDLITANAEYGVVRADAVKAGIVGLFLILAAIALYFMRLRAIVVMGATIAIALIWTFGFAELVIGQLDIVTAFLIPIVAGNGINVGILYQARYFGERGRGATVEEAVTRSLVGTWRPTLIAALASAAAYVSLLPTGFRAFRDFGIIAAGGMIICWVVKTLLVPPLIALMAPKQARASRLAMRYGEPFARFAAGSPTKVLIATIAVIGLGAVACARYVVHDPVDYDTRTLASDASPDVEHALQIANPIVGNRDGAIVVAADSAEEGRALADVLRSRWRDAPADNKPFAAVRTLWDFVPRDQESKLALVHTLGERLDGLHVHGLLMEPEWIKLREFVPPKDLRPVGVDDLPEWVARRFTDDHGTRGALVFIEANRTTANDVRDLVAFAQAFRETRLPSGKVLHGAGPAPVFADIFAAVVHDAPRAVLLSLILTVVVAVLALRSRVTALIAVLVTLMAAFGGVSIFLLASQTPINFVNFAAIPITFGIGVDYAINVAQRYYSHDTRDIGVALRTTGGAVVLCSLTTMFGYVVLLGSHHRGIRSLGAIASVGEACCLLAAVVVLPALLTWTTQALAQRRKRA